MKRTTRETHLDPGSSCQEVLLFLGKVPTEDEAPQIAPVTQRVSTSIFAKFINHSNAYTSNYAPDGHKQNMARHRINAEGGLRWTRLQELNCIYCRTSGATGLNEQVVTIRGLTAVRCDRVVS